MWLLLLNLHPQSIIRLVNTKMPQQQQRQAVAAYLAVYNGVQAVGWGAALLLTVASLARGESLQRAFLAGAGPAGGWWGGGWVVLQDMRMGI